MNVTLITNIVTPYRMPVFEILSSMNNINFRVLFCSSNESNRKWEVNIKDKISSKILKGFKFKLKNNKGIYQERHINFSIIKELNPLKENVIICGGYNSFATIYSVLFCKLFNKKVVLWDEGTLNAQGNLMTFRKQIKKFLIKQTNAFIVPGIEAFEYLEYLGANKNKIFIAPNSIDTKMFSKRIPVEKLELLKQSLGLKGKIVLYVGRVVKLKGIKELIDAYELILKKDIEVSLLIVGDGEDKEFFESYCRQKKLKNVVFTDFVEYNDLPRYYQIAKVFVLPTYQDVWGLVINEALTSEVPVVVSEFAGAARSLVKNEKNGFIINPNNVEEIAEAAFKILSEDKVYSKFCEESLNASRTHCPENTAAGFLKAVNYIENKNK